MYINIILLIIVLILGIKYYNLNKDYKVIKKLNNKLTSISSIKYGAPKVEFTEYEVKDIHVKYNKPYFPSLSTSKTYTVEDELKRDLLETCCNILADAIEFENTTDYYEATLYILKRK